MQPLKPLLQVVASGVTAEEADTVLAKAFGWRGQVTFWQNPLIFEVTLWDQERNLRKGDPCALLCIRRPLIILIKLIYKCSGCRV